MWYGVSEVLLTTEQNNKNISLDNILSCKPRVTVMSCFVYKVITDLESIDHLCINPINRIGFIHTRSVDLH